MQLHKNNEMYQDLIKLTADFFQLDPTIIEKDYWVTFALHNLAHSEMGERIVFKGGTSLTKCYADLRRFSEDIDIALLSEGLTNSSIKKQLKKTEMIMSEGFEKSSFEDEIASGNYRYIQYNYRSIFSGSLEELHPQIRFELTSFMEPYPYEQREVRSFVGTFLEENGYTEEMINLGLSRFRLNVLLINRTVIEKLVSLIRMSYEPDLKELLTKTRHLYDLYQTFDLVEAFYENPKEFHEMVELVKKAEVTARFKDTYPYEEKWFKAPLINVMDDKRIKKAYRENFGAEFVYGELPDYELVIKKIILIIDRLKAADL
nr:nucleotidyl transferase AbiEii/AbiGii toxin family protein [uncultured Acetobacterium sp.]